MKRIPDTNPVQDEQSEFTRRDAETRYEELNSPTIVDGQMLVGKAGLRLVDTFTWRKWSKMRLACLWEAVALHCYLDPRHMTKASIGYYDDLPSGSAARLYQERIAVAYQHLSDGVLKSKDEPGLDLNLRSVRLSHYAQWAQELGMPLPPEFPRTPTSKIGTAETADKWPWGSHDTALLRLLAEVGQFWKPESEGGNYDPADPTTAPTNEQIEAWLKERRVSIKVREVMATMLRADDMPSGRRRLKAK